MRRKLLVFYFMTFLFFISPLKAEILISEVFYDPLGRDRGKEWIELWNKDGVDIDLANYELTASAGDYYSFPPFSLAPGEVVVIHWNTQGIDTDRDLYTGRGFTNMGNRRGYVALFDGPTHNALSMVRYMEYGRGGNHWESIADIAGLWDDSSYAQDVLPGHSLELRYSTLGRKGKDFFEQTLPNPGIPPVPEPSTIYLFFMGLSSLLILRKKRFL